MKSKNQEHNGLLIGDIYHWVLDPNGDHFIKENLQKETSLSGG